MTSQTPAIVQRARANRRDPTSAEARMWSLLRDRRLRYKFRRQHPIGDYVVDFACPAIHLVIEVDGPSHNDAEQRAFDDMRAEALRLAGRKMLRVPNERVYQSLLRGGGGNLGYPRTMTVPLIRPFGPPSPRARGEGMR